MFFNFIKKEKQGFLEYQTGFTPSEIFMKIFGDIKKKISSFLKNEKQGFLEYQTGFTPSGIFNSLLSIIRNKMKKNLFNKKQDSLKFQSGFTLTELLVAIAIIGILSSIVLTSMSGARERAKDGKRISDIKQIQLALELYYDVNSAYPVDNGSQNILYNDPKPLTNFLKISQDPDGTNYHYWSTGQDYHLGAVLQQTNNALDDDDDATGGFEGSSSDCGSVTGTDFCYDVTP
ncbi:MAG: type II secretion system protein [Patescibacteria group bacterium]